MFGRRPPSGSPARDRLDALRPRWVPTRDDVIAASRRRGDDALEIAEGGEAPGFTWPDTDAGQASPAAASVRERPGRHSTAGLRPTWRLDAAAFRGVASLALAAAAGGLLVVVIGRSAGDPAPAASRPVAAKGDASSVLSEPSAPSEATVVVDVDGAVRHPGVVELPEGSRVMDAVTEAGGLLRRADTGALNLAQVLVDGFQVVVPAATVSAPPAGTPGGTDPTTSSGAVTAPVNLNTADLATLDELPGIGPVLAAAIIDWRTQNGAFTTVDQLQEVSGIGPATYEDLAPLVTVS